MNPFEQIAALITGQGSAPPAATPGAQPPGPWPGPFGPGTSLLGTPLDFIFGGSEKLANERLQQGGANDRLASTQRVAAEKEQRELQAAQELAAEHQRNLASANGDQNAALRLTIGSPVFSRAFAHGKVDGLISVLKGQRALATPDAPIVVQTPDGGRTELLNPANPNAPGRVIENPRDAAPDRAIQGQRAEALRKISDDGRAAQAELATLGQLRTTLDRVGADFPSGTWRGIAAQYGINVGPRTTDLQVANALIDRLVPSARQGLPGSASDRDVQMFRNSLPDLMRTAEGNRQILETLEALASSRAESARIAGSAFGGGADPARVWTELQAMPDPMTALEQRRTQRLSEVEGVDFGAVPRMTRPQLRQFTEQIVQHYGGAQNIPPRVKAIIDRRARQIAEAGR